MLNPRSVAMGCGDANYHYNILQYYFRGKRLQHTKALKSQKWDIKKYFKKVLDKRVEMWYNNYSKKKRGNT